MSENGYSSRTERRSSRREARRRERNRRLIVAMVPVVVVVAAVVAVLVLWGGEETVGRQTVSSAVATTESTVPGPTADVAGIMVLQEDDAAVLVLLSRHAEGGGLVLGIPGCTIIRTADGFQTLGESYSAGEIDALVDGLKTHLGVTMGGLAEVRWEALSDMLATATDQGEQPPTLLAGTPEASSQAAEAVLTFAKMMPADGGDLGRLGFTGDVRTVEYLVAQIAGDDTGSAWEASILPGRLVQGAGFQYYEPDEVAAGRMVRGEEVGPPKVVLEIQNGSGVLGAAEAAGDRLEALGYESAPFQNAPGFPDVAKTSISAPPGMISEAKKIRGLLVVGELLEDETLPPGTIRVVLGKDFELDPAGD